MIPSILTDALTDRIKLVFSRTSSLTMWPISAPVNWVNSFDSVNLEIGLLVDPETSLKLVDQGPPADDEKGAEAFQKIWGDRAELRRFKDGSILESVVWNIKNNISGRYGIVSNAITHLVQRHFGIKIERGVHLWGNEFIPFLDRERGLNEGVFKPIMNDFIQVSKDMRSLSDLPISITTVSPSSASLRYSSLSIPKPIAIGDPARYIEPIDIVITLESSTRWPDDLFAIQNMKVAFYLKIASQLESRYEGYKCTVIHQTMDESERINNRSYLELIAPSGFAYRARIYLDREEYLFQQKLQGSETDSFKKIEMIEAKEFYDNYLVRSCRFTTLFHNVCLSHPSLPTTVRLVKRWMTLHMLSNHIPEEVIELICAKVQMESGSWSASGTHWSGFIRVLHFLKDFDWKHDLFFVNLDTSASESDIATLKSKAHDNFLKLRHEDPTMSHSAMLLYTNDDTEAIWWQQRKRLSRVILGRLKVLAISSLQCIYDAINKCDGDYLKRLFTPPLQHYDALIYLNSCKCTRYVESLTVDAENLPKRQKYKNLLQVEEMHIGYDPVAHYLEDLKVRFFLFI